MRPLRRILLVHRPPAPGEQWKSNSHVRETLHVPPFAVQLAVCRLRWAAKVVAGGDIILALVQSRGGAQWRNELIRDFCLLRRVLPGKVGHLPDPRDDVAPWEALLKYRREWSNLLRLFRRTAAERPAWAEELCIEAGHAPSGEHGTGPSVSSGDGWLCGTCGREFQSFGGLTAHRARVHGHRAQERDFVVGTICPACGVDLRSRRRVRIHLRAGAASCREALTSGALVRADPTAVLAADRAQAAQSRESRRAGRDTSAGLPCRAALLSAPATSTVDGTGALEVHSLS